MQPKLVICSRVEQFVEQRSSSNNLYVLGDGGTKGFISTRSPTYPIYKNVKRKIKETVYNYIHST